MPLITSNTPSDASQLHLQDVLDQDGSMPIAIVGIACRLPGEATCPDKLWELLAKKEAAWSKVPEDRMSMDAFYHPDGERGGNVRIELFCIFLPMTWHTDGYHESRYCRQMHLGVTS